MVALSLLGGALGVAGYAAQHLPVCQTSVVQVQDGGLCVSPTISVSAKGAERSLLSVPYHLSAARDNASTTNRVLQPAQTSEATTPDGEISVVSWNLHHSTSRDADGARDQLGAQIQQLNEADAEVYLLQEVNPWHAQRIVDGTGLTGYYSQTTARQGNLILVNPGLEVHGNFRSTINHDITPGNTGEALQVVMRESGGKEPRLVQGVRVSERGSSETAVVFNTHLSTGKATPEARQAEATKLQSVLVQTAQGDEAVFGGGDLNQGRSGSLLQDLSQAGYQADGAKIDWLVSRGADLRDVSSSNLYDSQGIMLSDHPIVSGTIALSG